MFTFDTHSICDGPSKFDLSNALFDKLPGGRSRVLDFTTNSEKLLRVCVVVNKVSTEDGSRESWIIDGYISKIIYDGAELEKPPGDKIHFYYRTDKRSGWMKFQHLMTKK